MDGVKAVLVSQNPGKARELERLLPGWRIAVLGADEYPPEEGDTYYENARAKARFGREVGPPDAWTIGEDSGIEVEGLGGGPGLYSSRFGGDDPVGRMLAELAGIQGDGRRARYVCELVVLTAGGEELRGTGTLSGRIVETPAGSEGFGYDPIFVPDGEQRTVAELGDGWKAAGNSHRARAAQALREALAGHTDSK